MRLCGGKRRRAKAQLVFNLATTMKDNKKDNKCISTKRRDKENLHPLLDGGENAVTKDEQKAQVIHAFFPSTFNNKTSYL